MFATETVKLGNASMETNNGLLNHFRGTTGMKTGYVCASGLNIVATVERGGRRLLAVVLGGSSARERNELRGGDGDRGARRASSRAAGRASSICATSTPSPPTCAR